MSRPVELSDSVKNGFNPLKPVKLPVAEAKDITIEGLAGRRTEAVDQAEVEGPGQRGRPVTSSCPKRPLAGVPPIWSLSVPVDVWVKLPETVKVLPGPTVRLPLFVKPPAVVKSAPFVTTKVPLL